MNNTYLFLILVVMTFSSCRTPYDPDIEADQAILVVDAFLTNHSGASYVKLNMARPFDFTGELPPIHNAIVYLTDNTQEEIYFQETSPGYYEPVDTLFAGEINTSYELTLITTDGCIYNSKPETIPEDMKPSRVYGGYDQVYHLAEDAYGKTIKITEDVCAMYFDYMGDTEAPRFRYNSSQLVEYYVQIGSSFFYCWKTDRNNDLRLTYQKYASSSLNIYKQEVSISPADILVPTDEGDQVYEFKRIVEIKQYRLNNDSYEYYKQIKAQSEAEGKLFDPVISQIKGNISCINVPSKPVLGFFEASNLIRMSYAIRRSGLGNPVGILQVDNVAPHPINGRTLTCPDFWVF